MVSTHAQTRRLRLTKSLPIYTVHSGTDKRVLEISGPTPPGSQQTCPSAGPLGLEVGVFQACGAQAHTVFLLLRFPDVGGEILS